MSKEGMIAERAFISAGEKIAVDPGWSEIEVSAFVAPAAGVVPQNLADQPRRVGWKVRILWSISALMSALDLIDPKKVAALDADFDTAQRRLEKKATLDLTDTDPAISEAAQRVVSLLLPDGLAQNKLPYDQEVDFGLKQVAIAREKLTAEVSRLGLQPFMEHIERATKNLAEAIGLSPNTTRDAAKSRRIYEATRATQRDFKAVLADILWHVDYAPTAADREALLALAKPLQIALAHEAKL